MALNLQPQGHLYLGLEMEGAARGRWEGALCPRKPRPSLPVSTLVPVAPLPPAHPFCLRLRHFSPHHNICSDHVLTLERRGNIHIPAPVYPLATRCCA